MSSDILYRIPVTLWLAGTLERVLRTGRNGPRNWNVFWFDEYTALGGTSKKSGSKHCPRAAARGLWILGRLRNGKRPFLNWNTAEVYRHLIKNAAYASIAANLLSKYPLRFAAELWSLVQAEFIRCTNDIPADSEQGEVRLVVSFFRSQEFMARPMFVKNLVFNET